jgi:hypothetical protein
MPRLNEVVCVDIEVLVLLAGRNIIPWLRDRSELFYAPVSMRAPIVLSGTPTALAHSRRTADSLPPTHF